MKESQENLTNPGNSASTCEGACESVEHRVHELMDLRQALLSDTMVRDHISQCDQCAQLIVDLGALNDSVSQIPLATLHRLSGIQDAEVAKHQAPSQATSRAAHPVLFIASIACALLVMLTSGIWFSGQPQPQVAAVEVEVAESSPAENLPQVDSIESGSVEVSAVATVESAPRVPDVSVPEAMQQFGLLTHKTSSPTDVMGAVSFQDLSGNVEPYQEYIGMTAELPGIQPVSKSVNATFHLIKTYSKQLRPAL